MDFIEVEEVWKRSGSTRYGYVDPQGSMGNVLRSLRLSMGLDDWKKNCKRTEDLKEMDKFINKNYQDWVRENQKEGFAWVVRSQWITS